MIRPPPRSPLTDTLVPYTTLFRSSVGNALAEIGAPAELFSDPQRAADYDKIIIPGVGAFQEAMENLRSLKMVAALDRHVDEGKLLLGICLGMQLICRRSQEDGEHEGLGWIAAEVRHFPPAEDRKSIG